MNQYLIVRCHAGLGNRLRALVAGRRVARITGRHLAIIWSLDNYHCWCPFNALFTTPLFMVGEEFIRHPCRTTLPTARPTKIDLNSSFPTEFVTEENFFWVTGEEGIMWGQHSPYRMRNEAIRDELLKEFLSLVPVPYVQTEVDSFVSGLPDTTIGVHIRREDNVWSNKNCPDSAFVEVIDETLLHLPEAGILLATDSLKSERNIRSRYGKRVASYPVRSFARGQDWQSVQDALITMLLLAQTDILIRSCSSSFSQCASWFGNVPTLEVGTLEHLL